MEKQDPPVSRFLRLPVELRLCIYSECSALTLLQLSHTCLRARTEINSIPRILKESYGYLPPSPKRSSSKTILSVANVGKIQTAIEAVFYAAQMKQYMIKNCCREYCEMALRERSELEERENRKRVGYDGRCCKSWLRGRSIKNGIPV
ncbi:hypothetical protein BJ508DRAFT_303899 [Ascobolus immersus RN42]|uniref:F-box domain-containing protein n=1 Tax=Ascobolus immersus RN42 TaxID=1160509 RepID=A0A3N4IFP9_ASCIM|nr:hypothetical protein BJ508DRAFT_303899 [Ascobolus immersus RN42]